MMQKLFNALTGQIIEWGGTLEHFYASSDADQAGQWATEAAPAEIPLTLVPVELAPEPMAEPNAEVAADTHVAGAS